MLICVIVHKVYLTAKLHVQRELKQLCCLVTKKADAS